MTCMFGSCWFAVDALILCLRLQPRKQAHRDVEWVHIPPLSERPVVDLFRLPGSGLTSSYVYFADWTSSWFI
jgi:hypothetical protein